MPFGPLLGWKRGDIVGAAQRLLAAAMLAALAIAAAFALQHGGPVLAPFGIGLAVFVMAGALVDVAERTMILRLPFGTALRRAAGLPRSAWGTVLAHFGIGVTLFGIVSVTAWGSERIAALRIGDSVDVAHYRLTFEGLFDRAGPELSRARRPFRRAPHQRRVTRSHGAEPAQLPRPQHGDDRGCADDAAVEPALFVSGRSQSGRHRSGAALFQAAGADDLARRSDHVRRRWPLALRSAAARGRAAAGEEGQPRRCRRRSDRREAAASLHAAARASAACWRRRARC